MEKQTNTIQEQTSKAVANQSYQKEGAIEQLALEPPLFSLDIPIQYKLIHQYQPVAQLERKRVKRTKQKNAKRLGRSGEGKLQEDESSTLDTIADGVEKVTNVPADLIGNEGVTGVADALNGKTVLTDTQGTTGDDAVTDKEKHAANMGVVGDSIVGINGLLGFVQGFRDATNPENALSERFEAFLNYEQSGMAIGESVAKLTATFKNGNTDTAAAFGSSFEAFGAGIGAIKEFFLTIKTLVEAIKEKGELDTKEKVKAGSETALHALETAKSAVLSVKAFYELIEGAAAGGLMAGVPVIDYLISMLKIGMQGYYLIQSDYSYIMMKKEEKRLTTNDKDGKMKKASEEHRSNDAMISNKQALIAEDEATIAKIDKQLGVKDWAFNNPDKASGERERKKKRIKRIAQLKKDIAALKLQKSIESSLSKEDVAEFTMVKELKDSNRKRVHRQVIHISAEMTKIAGSLATLSGVGGIAGGILKGAGAGIDLGTVGVRTGKQKGRDHSARENAKQPVDDKTKKAEQSKSKFDVTKSSAAKKDFRLEQIRTLIKKAMEIGKKKPSEAPKEYEKLNLYLMATGVNTNKLFKANGKPDEQITMLFQAITKREF